MPRRLTILQDSRYPAFVKRYADDPLRFAVECTGLMPSKDQTDLFEAIRPHNARVSVVSGTGTGKTFAYARIALWHLLCHPFARYDGKTEIGSNTYIGAPIIKTVSEGLWKEMQDTRNHISEGPCSWLNRYYNIQAEKVSVIGYEAQWFITRIAMKKGESIGVAGKHRYWQMVIVDEAAGVPDDHFNVINGTQTQPGNRTLLASQGVRNAGFFYDTHHSLSQKNGGAWTSLCFSSERSPFVTEEWLHERELETGGRNSVEYQIRVLGRFAQSSSNVLLTRVDLDRGFEQDEAIEPHELYGYMVLVDVAMGEYRDDSVIVVAKVVGYGDNGEDARRVEYVEIPVCSNDKQLLDFAGEVKQVVDSLPNASLYVDAGGVGAALIQTLEREGLVVNRINWGKPCFRKQYKERFYNQRACAMVRFRDAVRQGRVRFPKGLSPRMRERIIDQGTRLPYHFAEAGGLRYKIESKEEMRKNGIKSPDVIDAMSFAFLEDASYMVADENRESGESAVENLMKHAELFFKDL